MIEVLRQAFYAGLEAGRWRLGPNDAEEFFQDWLKNIPDES